MHKRLPPLNSLKAFESSARHLSFTKAADELFVTQAAVSHQIKILEDFLGIPLFKRKNRTLELTEEGKIYFNDVAKALKHLSESTWRLLDKKNEKHLTISVPQTFGMQWLVPHLSEFNRQHPDIDVRLKGVDHDEGALNDVDVAVYYGRGHWHDLKVEKLAQENLLLLASPKLLKKQPLFSPQDLKHHTLIHIHTYENWQTMVTHLQLEDINIQHGPLFSHTFMALQAAVHGQGIVLANRLLARLEIENGNLQVALPVTLKDPKSFYVVSAMDQADKPHIVAFRQWIMSAIKKKGMQ